MIPQASDHEDLIEASRSCRPCPSFWDDRYERLRIHGVHCSGCIRRQDRGLIDLGCASETKLRRTHDKGKGVRATPQLLQPESHFLAYTARLVPFSRRLRFPHGMHAQCA